MQTTETFYAVELPCRLHPERSRLAIGGSDAGPRLFFRRKPAVEFKNGLVKECGFKSARVVRVRCEYSWEG